MKAAVVNVLSQPPQYQEFPEPILQEGEVAIKLRAAGLHPVVKSIASGAHYSSGGELPLVPGVDGVGTREDGSRVYFGGPRKPWGTMAELATAPRSMCIPLPDGIDDVQAAAIANPGMSAWVSLQGRAQLNAGETVMILGATGVAGQLALQIARILGAKRVVAVGRNVDAIAHAGADSVIALGQSEEAVSEVFAAEAAAGIDVVIDYLWGRPTELLLGALAKGFRLRSTQRTRLVEVGESAGKTIALPGAVLRGIDLTLKGSGFGSASMTEIFAAIPKLFALAAEGKLNVAVDPVPLADVEAAWSRVEKGRRIVFTI
jgi:NADPH:quinone reductase-like Zn-dependent oxidoreductase